MGKVEAAIQAKIIKYLESEGAYVRKTITMNKKGTPDIIGCLNGRFIAIEVKQPGGVATELQKYNIELIRGAGGIAGICYSLEEAKKLISS